MPLAESWFENPGAWDTVFLGGDQQAIPGLCAVKAKLGRKLDSKGPAGSDGANIRDKGYKLAEVEVTVTLWTEEQWSVFNDMLDDLLALRVPRSTVPLDIRHPALRALGITQVYLEELDAPEEASNLPGAKSIKLKFLQYKPPTQRRGTGRVNNNAPITTTEGENASVDPSQSASEAGPPASPNFTPAAPPVSATPDQNFTPNQLYSGG